MTRAESFKTKTAVNDQKDTCTTFFVPVFHDPKKDIYKVSANELVDRRALTTFHHDLSKAVEHDLGYEVSIMTGEATLRREQGLRGSIDILKYEAQKLAELVLDD